MLGLVGSVSAPVEPLEDLAGAILAYETASAQDGSTSATGRKLPLM